MPSTSSSSSSSNKRRWNVLTAFSPASASRMRQIRTFKEILWKGTDEDICNYINQHPLCCNEKYNFGGKLGQQYPLYVLCDRCSRKRLTLETIQFVYEANPNAIDGCLHHAIGKKASLEVVKFLLLKTPDGAKTLHKGWLPLHKACATNASIPIVEYLIEAHPNGLRQRACGKLHLPLHIAVEHCASFDLVVLLATKYPNALKMADYETKEIKTVRGWLCYTGTNRSVDGYWGGGGLPLHLACRDRPHQLRLIKFLILQYPDALKSKNRTGWLPLHFSCFSGSPLNIIQMLVNCCPDAVLEPTMDRRWPVDMCTSRFNPNMATIQYILSKHPTTTGQEPNHKLFYHYFDEAYAVAFTPRVVQFLRAAAQRSKDGYTFVYPREF